MRHPSYLLRLPDEAARAREYERFVSDLRSVGRVGGEAVTRHFRERRGVIR